MLFGIVVPPHEAYILETCWLGYRNNVLKCSRGTSKSFTVGSFFAPLRAILYCNNKILIASASRFRGGKLVMNDSEKLVEGNLDGQILEASWVRKSITHAKTIKHDPDLWSMTFSSNSQVFTLPTNNESTIRGVRANTLILDERNTHDDAAIQDVYRPFLNVGTNFRAPAEGSEGNQIYSVGTIDYSYRDWYKDIMATKDLCNLQYLVNKAMMEGDWDTYDSLMEKHGRRIRVMSTAFIRYDYTDLLIPTVIGNYEVKYPGAIAGRDIRWDERDQVDYIYTYPVNKTQLEEPFDEGISDKESWEAEQRNIFIRASGSVYSPELVEKCTGPIFTSSEEEKRGHKDDRYVPPVLYKSTDPCVLGIDTARTADFSGFVVIRIGEAPQEFFRNARSTYSLKAHAGPSLWANVIWAEQHQHMTSREASDLIRELRQRYNIITTSTFPGMVMDVRGGGAHVRDDLALPKPPLDATGRPVVGWVQPEKIFDPEDDDYKHLLVDDAAWSGLKLLATTDIMNQELVSFSRAQMQAGRLYIGAYKSPGDRRNKDFNMNVGYLGVRTLKHQLLRIQATPTARSVKFEMPGDVKKIENKKDMLMAFLYACYAVKDIYNTMSRATRTAPAAYGTVIRL